MHLDRLSHLPPDHLHRVERVQGVLGNERDLGSADRPHLLRGERKKVAPPIHRPPGGDPDPIREQPNQRLGSHRLAAAGLADEAHDLPFVDAQGHVSGDWRGRQRTPFDLDTQTLDDEEGAAAILALRCRPVSHGLSGPACRATRRPGG